MAFTIVTVTALLYDVALTVVTVTASRCRANNCYFHGASSVVYQDGDLDNLEIVDSDLSDPISPGLVQLLK